MTDQIPADKVRPILDEWERIKEYADWEDMDSLVQEVRALLPPPPRPTMADMTPEERKACRWLQADMEDEVTRAVIIHPYWEDGSARVLWSGGFIEQIGWERVTPRPDLPRVTWPGDQQPAPAAPALPEGWRLADHPQHGRGIVTRPVPDRNGYVCFVLHSDGTLGHSWHFCTPDELTYIDTGPEAADATD